MSQNFPAHLRNPSEALLIQTVFQCFHQITLIPDNLYQLGSPKCLAWFPYRWTVAFHFPCRIWVLWISSHYFSLDYRHL